VDQTGEPTEPAPVEGDLEAWRSTGERGPWFQADAAPPPPPPTPPERSRRTLLAASIALVLVIGLVGGAIALTSGGGGSPDAARTTPPSASPSIVPPTELVASAGAFQVTLRWTQPPGGSKVQTYEVDRNGGVWQSVSAPATDVTDDTVLPGHRYTYAVEAKGEGATSPQVTVSIRTRVPPLSDARVEGTFNVTAKVTSHSGFTSYPSTFTLGWDMKPKCSAGACSVTWKDVTRTGFAGTFVRKGASYSGSDSGQFGAQCGSSGTASTLTIAFHVTRAGPMFATWRATKLAGTISEYAPATGGCVSAHASMTITATLSG
jgi:hypothetical protein